MSRWRNVVVFLLLLGCCMAAHGAGASLVGAGSIRGGNHALPDPVSPGSPVKLIFIHHSTGEHWLADGNGGLGIALRDANYFVSDTNYGWGPNVNGTGPIGDRTDIGNWWEWFRGPDSATYLAALYNESGQASTYSRMATDPGGVNRVVMIKSCFPNSALRGSPDDPIPPIDSNPLRGEGSGSDNHTISNAKGIYIDILNYFREHQETLFIVITAPPLQDGSWAPNARALNEWLVHDWLSDYPYQNVFVFDFYNVLTTNGGGSTVNDLGRSTGNHHRWQDGAVRHLSDGVHNQSAYPSLPSDDHPTRAGNLKATGEYIPLLNYAVARWSSVPVSPVAAFGADRTGGSAPLTVAFTDASTGYPLWWNWDFGDGTVINTTSSQDQVFHHTFSAEGSYVVNLTVGNNAGQNRSNDTVITVIPNLPYPVISSLSPVSTAAGGAGFTLTVKGGNFTAGSRVQWNGANRTTTFVSSQQVKAVVPAGDIVTPGDVPVRVVNDDTGWISVPKTFTVTNPSPKLSSMKPKAVPANSSSFNLTLTGTGFTTQSIVLWNGATRVPVFISGKTLNLTVSPADVAVQQVVKVGVLNPSPGGGRSSNQTLTVGNPLPVISSASPASIPAGSPGASLELTGFDFVPGAQVYWGTGSKKTQFVSSNLVRCNLTAADLSSGRYVDLKVKNPTPGGGFSNVIPFPVLNPIPGITSISPTRVKAGENAFSLTVNGFNFTKASVVLWNGTNIKTTFSSSTKIGSKVPTSTIGIPGLYNVTAFNPAPGGGSSANLTIEVFNPQPTIMSLNPSSRKHGNPPFNLTVNGRNFTAASVVVWDGSEQTTFYQSPTLLKAWIPVPYGGPYNLQVKVLNKAEGGGDLISAGKNFSIT